MPKARTSRACRLCLSCKTKCEPIDQFGCKRCMEKKRICSFVETAQPGSSSSAIPLPVVSSTDNVLYHDSELVERLQQIEHRLDGLDARKTDTPLRMLPTVQQFPLLGNIPGISTYPSPQISDHLASGAPAISCEATQINGYPHFDRVLCDTIFDENFFSLQPPSVFPDILGLGILTPAELDYAYMTFQRRFTAMITLPPFCSLSSPRQQLHPFFALAIACHSNFADRIHPDLIRRSISIITCGSVGLEEMRALFVLALAPVQKGDMSMAPISPSWYLELAWSIGRRLRVESRTRWTLKDPETLYLPYMSEAMELVLLWENIKVRLNVVSLLQTAATEQFDLNVKLLPDDHPSEDMRRAICQLKRSVAVLDVVKEFLPHIIDAEHQISRDAPDGETLKIAWTKMQGKLENIKPQGEEDRLLTADIAFLWFCLSARLSCLLRRLPTPVGAERMDSYRSFVGMSSLMSLHRVITYTNSVSVETLRDLPAYQAHMLALDTLIVQRSIATIEQHYPSTSSAQVFNLSHVKSAETKLSEASQYFAFILETGKARLAELYATNTPPHGTELPGDMTDESIWSNAFPFFDAEYWKDIDLSAFDFSNIIGQDPQSDGVQ